MPQRTSLEKNQFQRMLTRHMVLPLSVGAISGAVFIGLIVYLVSVLDWVEHTQQVIGKANELTTLSADLQTGARGFLLTGDESSLQPYNVSKPRFAAEMAALEDLVKDNPPQIDRLRRIQAFQRQWDRTAQDVIEARRKGLPFDEMFRTGGGRQVFDEMRKEYQTFIDVERTLLTRRSETAHSATAITVILYVALLLLMSGAIAVTSRRQTVTLSETYGDALRQHVESSAVLQQQAWLREGQAQLAEQLVGRQALQVLGRSVLDFMARYLDAEVAALYVRQEGDRLHRVAAHGFDAEAEAQGQSFGLDDGLVGLAARDGRINHVRNLAGSYLKVRSGLGEGPPIEVVVVPLRDEGVVNGVLELGFMRPVAERDLSLLAQVAAGMGASLEAAHYRKRLQDTLEETHQLNEELQVQQEELRTANEELEEQSRVLMESQVTLEHQQAELEQTNQQLADQALELDGRNEALRQAQDDLEGRAQELQRASRYKSEFLANMSHELRTPLNSALILSKLLSDNKPGNLTDDQVKYARTIYSAGNDLLHLINDILDISKVEAGKLELSPQAVALPELLESLRMTFAPLAGEKALEFEVGAAPGTPPSIFTDSERLAQVLKNLLSNAIKFTSQGCVALSVDSPAPGEVRFAVSDSGIGIAPDQQGAIFEAFRQADGTINRRYGGTGLGLSISRELTGLLGGSIRVDSRPGQGSTFTLAIPVEWTAAQQDTPVQATASAQVPAPAAAPAAADAAPAPAHVPFADDRLAPAGTGGLVLAVEDDPAFAAILYELAHEMNYRCLVAHSAAEGFQLASQHQPDAILLDVRLPDASGLTVLQRLKDDPRTRHIPVHIVSGEDFSEIGLHLGAIGAAVKPTTREELRGILARLAEKGARGKVKRVLLVEDDERQRRSVVELISDDDVRIDAVARGDEALALLRTTVFDCMIIDLKLPDMEGGELLERMSRESLPGRGTPGEGGTILSFPPVIVYTGRNLTRKEEAQLNRYSRSIIIKGARSPERLLDEVTLFLHKVESQLSAERQSMLKTARNRDKVFEGRKVLLVDDDVRNIFALMSALEQKGLAVEVGRNGFEALAKLDEVDDIDLVLMDVMMPGMDGLEATRRIRANPRLQKLPVIAITAKAMKDDQEQCRRAGANDYLAKPIDLDRLFSLLRVWMPSLERL
jgi:signal transduction histidine kinase/CheY-like chemotaxis protein/CHASE3 domain sensor protein